MKSKWIIVWHDGINIDNDVKREPSPPKCFSIIEGASFIKIKELLF